MLDEIVGDYVCGIVGEAICGLVSAVAQAGAQSAAPALLGTLIGVGLSAKAQQKPPQPRRPLPVIGFFRARWAQATGRVPSWTAYYEQEP